ncbi:hypothetical protein [uncultured Methanoregula sp.]|uniref:hypothetical protein n=1 Tax=uncultured Methanoregula sp. TaxID=1005933 RepID=UPI002AAADC57|nr:hypothetical protein [uncultured Methanoregula sp.]
MPHTSDDTLGRRRFQISRDQAVEAAIEKIRYAPDADWHSFSGTDYACLRAILGELWSSLDHQKWEQYAFSALTRQDIRALLVLGAGLPGHCLSCATVNEMDVILSRTLRNPEKP